MELQVSTITLRKPLKGFLNLATLSPKQPILHFNHITLPRAIDCKQEKTLNMTFFKRLNRKLVTLEKGLTPSLLAVVITLLFAEDACNLMSFMGYLALAR